jgi:four helix bundle protein
MTSGTYSRPAPQGQRTFKTFEDLELYRLARAFRTSMYGVARRLPEFEKFELAAQIRRAAVSLTNNIAEGHGRYHYLDQIRFTLIARGSLEELIDDLNVCADEAYVPQTEVAGLKDSAWQVHRVMAGYLRYLREKKFGAGLALRDEADPGATLPDCEAPESVPSSTIHPFNSSTNS